MKRFFSAILILAMVVTMLAGLSLTASAETYSGTCGESLTWTLDTETGVLEITGTGQMPNWSYRGPWYSYRRTISSVSIGSGVTSIGDYAFYDCTRLTGITIPGSVTSIGASAFSGCWGLTSVTLSNSVTSIGVGAFAFCHSLTSVTLGNSVTSIGVGAFEECSLTSITIPESVMSIGSGAFYDCNLSSIRIPESVTSIGAGAFERCSLTRITVAENNTVYDSRNNCEAIIDTASNTLIVGSANTVIPDSVTSIGKKAFCCLTGLTSIVIPDGVTSIGDNAFLWSNLATVTIPISVTSIGFAAFDTVLTDVYYLGTEADWNRISIGEYNGSLTGATIHYLAEGLKIDTASLTLYEDIVVNFAASVPEGLTDPYMVVELDGQSYTLQASREDTQGRPVFEFMNLTPDQMGDNIKATLYTTTEDGQLVHYCKPTYSVRQYCTNVMAAYPEDAKLQTLLADMLVYGAATQRFTGHNADSLVTAGLELAAASAFTNLTDTDLSMTDSTDANIQWTGAGLECGSRMSMYFTLTTTVGDATSVSVTINGRTTEYEYADIVTDDPTVCRVVFRGISASEYGDIVTAVLKSNGTPVQTLTYSVNSYIYAKQDDNTVENLSQLVQAIYNYGASAKNYLNK